MDTFPSVCARHFAVVFRCLCDIHSCEVRSAVDACFTECFAVETRFRFMTESRESKHPPWHGPKGEADIKVFNSLTSTKTSFLPAKAGSKQSMTFGVAWSR